MADKVHSTDANAGSEAPSPAPVTPPRRGPGHRGADMRDTMAEMAQRAQEISMEAGSKVAAAMRDVIGAAAGLSGFAVESARDLVQYMIRRGQMTPEEGEKLLREAEAAAATRPRPPAPPPVSRVVAVEAPPVRSAPPSAPARTPMPTVPSKPVAKAASPGSRPAAKAPAKAPAKGSAKAPAKSAKAPARPAKSAASRPAVAKKGSSAKKSARPAAKKKR